jgi:hypothetical protein
VNRKLETPAQRQARLEYGREYIRARRAAETPEQRKARLEYQRGYRTRHKAETLAGQRRYYREHRTERLAYATQYNQARRDREHASEAEYRAWFKQATPAERIAYQKAVREKKRLPTGSLDAAEVRSLVGVRGRLRKLTPALAEAVGAWLHAQGWRAEAEQGLYWAPPDVVAVHGDPPPKSWCDLHLQLAARRALEST